MVSLVSEYVTLTRRAPDDFWGRCPFHDEKSASFHIRPNKGLFKCFGCGKGGDVFRFVEEIEGVNFGDALRRLAQRAGVELKARTPQERAQDERRGELLRASQLVSEFYERVLWSETPAGERARAYLKERGISDETAKSFGLGVAPDEWGTLRELAERNKIPLEIMMELGLVRSRDGGRPYDFFRDRLMFPIRDEQGKCVAFGGRTLSGDDRKYMNSQEIPGFYEKRRLLYGLDKARKSRAKRLVVVEGYMDVVIPHQVGRTEFVAALGTALTPDQARLARRYVDEVVILFDADEAGTNASLRALANLVTEKGLTVKVARLPDGLDPDEAVRADPALLEKALDDADDLIAFIIDQTLSGYERTSAAGQERAILAAIKLLAKIPDKIRLFRELAQVAQRFGLPEEVLRSKVSEAELVERRGGPMKRRPQHFSQDTDRMRQTAPSAPVQGFELHLLEALLALPDGAAQVVKEGGGPEAFSPGTAQLVAATIFQLAAEGPVEPAHVMGRLEDSGARDLCGHLIGRIDPNKDYARDIAGWSKLHQRSAKKHRQALLRQIRTTTDTSTKKQLLEQYQTLREGTAPLGQ